EPGGGDRDAWRARNRHGGAGTIALRGSWFDNTVITHNSWPATVETLAMTLISTVLSVVLGTITGLVLVGTAKGGLFPNRVVNQILGAIVNVGRSIPFVILMIAISPLTKILAGTTIGWEATIFPLTV